MKYCTSVNINDSYVQQKDLRNIMLSEKNQIPIDYVKYDTTFIKLKKKQN